MSNYYRSGAASNSKASPFYAPPKPGRFGKYLVRSVDVLLLLALVVLMVRSLMVSSKAVVVATSTFYHSQTNYQDSATNYLHGLSDRTKISFNQNAVAADFRRDYPEVNAVSVELPIFSQRPIIRLQIAPPAFFLQSADKSFVIDSDGRAVSPKSHYLKPPDLVTVVDQAGFADTLGKQVLSSDNVLFITDLINQSKKSGVPIKSLVLPQSPSELDLYTTDQPYFVKFNLSGNPTVQIGQFLAARHNFSQKNIQPSQYLDVRVNGRVFYK